MYKKKYSGSGYNKIKPIQKPEKKQWYHYMAPDMDAGPFLVIGLYGYLLPESQKYTGESDNINNELLKYLLESDKKIIIIEPVFDISGIAGIIKSVAGKTGLPFFGFFPTVPGYSPPFLNCWKKINEICDFSQYTGNFLSPNLAISTPETFIKQKCFSNNVKKDTFITYNSIFNKPEIKIATKINKEYLTEFVKRDETKLPDADIYVLYGNRCSGKSFLVKKLTKSGILQVGSDFRDPEVGKKYVFEDYCNNNTSKSEITRRFKKFNRKVLFVEMNTPKEICRLLNYVSIESDPEIPFYDLEDYELTYEKNNGKFENILFNIKLDLTNGIKVYY